MQPYNKLKSYTIIYQFNHSKMGFQNSITVKEFTLEDAMKNAKEQVSEVYGSDMLKKFSFKPDPLNNGTVI